MLDALAGGDAVAGVVRGRRGTGCILAALLAAAGCGDEGPAATISREVFVETYVALRVAELSERTDDGIPAEARERVLAERGVTEDELLTFAEVHGSDVNFMEQLWDDVENRLEEIRNARDMTDPGAAGAPPGQTP